jgi:hypothetical protein
LAQKLIVADFFDENKFAVSARNEKGNTGKFELIWQGEHCEEMTFEVINSDERLLVGERERLGSGDAHAKGSDQARAVCHCDGI